MATAKDHIEYEIRRLEEVIEKCDFIRTASIFSTTVSELTENFNDDTINSDEYKQFMDKTVKILTDSKCKCTKAK